jgi:hypothetical protein
VLELDPVAITSVGGGCARAATVGEESDAVETVAAQCSGGNCVEVLPVTTALPHLEESKANTFIITLYLTFAISKMAIKSIII